MRKRTVLRTLIVNTVLAQIVDKKEPTKGIQNFTTEIYGVKVSNTQAENYVKKHTPNNIVIVDVTIVEVYKQEFIMDEVDFCQMAVRGEKLPLDGTEIIEPDEE